jgi:hypothetical protein
VSAVPTAATGATGAVSSATSGGATGAHGRRAGRVSLFGLDPATWTPHPLHGPDRSYRETSCYADVLIELVAALGSEPEAMFASAAAVDFELDQWSFVKPYGEDLRRLYGLEVHEIQPVGPLPEQIAARLEVGHTVLPELDAWFLPDTEGTSYRQAHVKTSVIAEAIDLEREVFAYFHNAGYYELSGEDYRGVFRLDPATAAAGGWVLPPYLDVMRPEPGGPLTGDALREEARRLLAVHLARRPADNPVERFGARLALDLPDLLAGDLQRYHDYAFATVRMLGAAFELLASHVRWSYGEAGETAALACDELVAGSKVLSFRLARRKPFDVAAAVAPMARAWEQAQQQLDQLA